MNFGQATQLMIAGGAACRAGWNGKGMFIYYVPGGLYPAQTDIAKRLIGDKVAYLPYLAMKTVQGPVVPWLSSQTDTLANDWEPYQP